MSPPITQYPYPVRAPASIAAIGEDGSILSKSSIPVPLVHVSATAFEMSKVSTSQEGKTKPNGPVPSSSAGVNSGW